MSNKETTIRDMDTSPWKGNNLPEGYKTLTIKTEIPQGLPLLKQAAAAVRATENARQHFEQILLEQGAQEEILSIGRAESSGTFQIVGHEETVKQLVESLPDLELCK